MESVTIKTRACPMCGKSHKVTVSKKGLELYNSPNRPYIQDCFPELSNEEREMLITGTCPECWKKMFSDDEENDEL